MSQSNNEAAGSPHARLFSVSARDPELYKYLAYLRGVSRPFLGEFHVQMLLNWLRVLSVNVQTAKHEAWNQLYFTGLPRACFHLTTSIYLTSSLFQFGLINMCLLTPTLSGIHRLPPTATE